MTADGDRFEDRRSGRWIQVTSRAHNSFIDENIVHFHYLDNTAETRQLPESEFKRLTKPQVSK